MSLTPLAPLPASRLQTDTAFNPVSNSIPRLLVAFFIWTVVPFTTFAQTVSSSAPKPSPMEDLWQQSPIVAYGRIIRLELAPTPANPDAYFAVLRIERVWKGHVGGNIVIHETSASSTSSQGLRFNQTYVLQLSKKPDADLYLRQGSQEIVLPAQQATDPATAVFGISPYLGWIEFLERKTGNLPEAERIRKVRGQDSLDREQTASVVKLFSDIALAEYRAAMQEAGVWQRKVLLEALFKRIEFHEDADMIALAAKVKSEISVANTLLAAGKTAFPY